VNYRSDKTRCRRGDTAFTFIEVVTALAILGVITSSVLVVLNRSVEAVIDGRLRMQAFQLARENMEKLLASSSVSDMAQFGTHELNDDIEWEIIVEPFNEPVKSGMWIRAICSASYTDRHGQRRRIELIHWLGAPTGRQRNQILEQQKRQQEFLEATQGNPFGNDPDGLMQYARALSSMGQYAEAADAVSRILTEYPDSAQASLARDKMVGYAWSALSEGELEDAGDIIDTLRQWYPDDPDVEKLPRSEDLQTGLLPSGLKFPPGFEPRRDKTLSDVLERDGSGSDGQGPDETTPDKPESSEPDSSEKPPQSKVPLPPEWDSYNVEQKQIWWFIINREPLPSQYR